MKSIKDIIAFLTGKLLLSAAKLLGKDGYHVPGLHAFSISGTVLDFIKKPETIVFISGTNGKSTTTSLIKHILINSGRKVAFNTESNTQPGIISALLQYTTIFNKSKADILILEVAEEAIHKIAKFIKPHYLLLTNVQDDTFQANLSPNYINDKIKSIISDDMVLFLNNEDPKILSYSKSFSNYFTYGVRKNQYGSPPDTSLYSMSEPCPLCQNKIIYKYMNIPSIGRFRCSVCDFKSFDETDYYVSEFDLETETITINDTVFPMHYRAPHFAYNYLLAYSFVKALGVADDIISKSFGSFVNIGGRIEEIKLRDTTIHYSRFKQETPDTLQCSIDQICMNKEPKTVVVSLNIVDHGPWGPMYTDTFYSYDCDFAKLMDSNVDQFICTGDVVAFDTANRLVYAGIPKDMIKIINSDDPGELIEAIRQISPKQVYILAYLAHFKKIRKAICDDGQ